MPGHKESIVAFGVVIQPTPGTFVASTAADLIPISAPDVGFDPITAEDPTLTGAIWSAPQQFLGKRGRAGATAALRGPGGATPPALGAWPLGRILQAAGFTELRNATDITGTPQANAVASNIVLAAAASAVDDFYNGMGIRHVGIGADVQRSTSMVRDYVGSSKTVTLTETLGAAIGATGTYTIPAQLTYLLSTGLSIPLLSCSVWRHKVRRDFRDCALSSFAINIPVANDQNTALPSIEFALVGTLNTVADQDALSVPSSALTPVPAARAGKFTFNGVKYGHQSMRLEFGLESGAPPNQNFDAGQEAYEILTGSRTVNLDLNQQLVATLDLDTSTGLVDTQASVPIMAGWGLGLGNRFVAGVPESFLQPFSPQGRNGFVGVSGTAGPSLVDKSVALSVLW